MYSVLTSIFGFLPSFDLISLASVLLGSYSDRYVFHLVFLYGGALRYSKRASRSILSLNNCYYVKNANVKLNTLFTNCVPLVQRPPPPPEEILPLGAWLPDPHVPRVPNPPPEEASDIIGIHV